MTTGNQNVFTEVENRVRNEHLTVECAAKNVPIMESCQKAILASRPFQEFCDDIQKKYMPICSHESLRPIMAVSS